MNSKLWIRRAVSTCLMAVTVAAYSMVTLASAEKVAGEITVSGRALNGQTATVKVNGETAQSGRSIFSSSTIATPENATAVVNLGQAGKLELAPNSVMSLSFDEKTVSGDLSAGRVTVLSAAAGISVKTPEGKTVELNAGESASAQTQTDNDDNGGGIGTGLIVALVLGGAAAGIILAATTDNNRIALGGGTTIVSTTR